MTLTHCRKNRLICLFNNGATVDRYHRHENGSPSNFEPMSSFHSDIHPIRRMPFCNSFFKSIIEGFHLPYKSATRGNRRHCIFKTFVTIFKVGTIIGPLNSYIKHRIQFKADLYQTKAPWCHVSLHQQQRDSHVLQSRVP